MNNKTSITDSNEAQIQENIANWQAPINPLAPLTEDQLDLVYQLEDIIKAEYFGEETTQDTAEKLEELQLIDSNKAFIKWFIQVENEVKNENLGNFKDFTISYTNKVKMLKNYLNILVNQLNTYNHY
ncbi:hypothetical protein HHI36_002820 [Cryptolaemus montrouzieri]|uniref:Uncharacterized protein n=1 Tax=Cryptolaemus montrouzieri TaxID=559131 RepID=A0ABD2PCF1_9CUCU